MARAAHVANLYRRVRVVMSDGATYWVPSATRLVGNTLQLERDTANHPVFLGTSDQSGLLDRREEARLNRVRRRNTVRVFGDKK